ncbi:MAG TPA: hypothetical protein VGO56_06950 [Pyrinomonadaceae bacterium]|jgi:hypothetical protein|nr:hypothetical protein [Pyrinomonadaceae bacterium]
MSEAQNDNLTDPQALAASRQAAKLELEIKKLNLETENLQKKNKWEPYSPLIPIFASFVTVLTLVIGFWQFQRTQSAQQEKARDDQKQERIKRFESRLRADVDELSRFSQDKNQTPSRLSVLLDDWNIIRVSTTTGDLSPEVFEGYERTLTRAFVRQIVEGLDLLNQKDATFATTIAKNWDGYHNYLQQYEQQPTLDKILNNYTVALRYLRDKNPKYFDTFRYDKNARKYFEPANFQQPEGQDLLQHYLQLLDGFKANLDLLVDPRSQETKTKNIRAFGNAVQIKSVAEHVLGKTDSALLPPMPQ